MINYLGEIGNLPKPFTDEELKEYFKRMNEGDRLARDEIINHNMRLIADMIEKKFPISRLDKEELFSNGLIGLIKAVDSFDLNMGIAFSSYASKCIRNEILMLFRREKKRFNDISLSDSLYTNKDGDEITIEDKLEDERVDLVLDYEREETYKIIRKIITELPDREQFVITKYFYDDLNDYQIGNLLGISQSYTNRVRNRALKKIDERLQELGITNDKIDIVKSSERGVIKTMKANNKTIKLPNINDYLDGYSREQIEKAIKKLSNKDQNILNKYFFLNGNRLMIPQEIASFYNMTELELLSYISDLILKLKEIIIKTEEVERVKKVEDEEKIQELIKKINKQGESKDLTIYQYLEDFTKEEVQNIFSKLSNKEQDFVNKYFSIVYDNKKLKTKELADYYGMTCSEIIVYLKNLIDKMKKIGMEERNKKVEDSLEDKTGILETESIIPTKKNIKTRKKLKTIYEYFSGYSKEEIEVGLSKLGARELETIKLRYGEDLENPVVSENFTSKERNYFYQYVIPKMRKILANPNQSFKNGRKLKTIYEYFSEYSKEDIDLVLQKLNERDLETIKLRYGEDLENPVTSEKFDVKDAQYFYGNVIPKLKRLLSKLNLSNQKDTVKDNDKKASLEIVDQKTIEITKRKKKQNTELAKEDYLKILELIKNINFSDMLKHLTAKEAVIICLKLGMIEDKYFTTDSIADFLGITKEEVLETTKKILYLYRDSINEFIDKAISYTNLEESKVQKLTR